MKQKKRILILTVDAGFGHRSAANAVATAMSERHADDCECLILNPFFDRPAPFFFRNSHRDYDKTVRKGEGFYKLTYDMSDTPFTSQILEGALTLVLYQVMKEMVEEIQPDAILSTYHLYHAPLGEALKRNHAKIPFYVVITELAEVHKLWLEPSPDLFFVANEVVRNEAIKHGITDEKICVSGIPIKPQFARETRSKDQIRQDLGWDLRLPTILAVGSRRVDHMTSSLQAINECGLPVQLAMVAGGDERLYTGLKKIPWRLPVHLYNYVENIPAMMRAADILVSKAGGLIIAEGLASGLPILLIDSIAGQETGNLAYVIEQEVGAAIEDPGTLLEVLDDWLRDDGKRLKRVAQNSVREGRANSADQVSERIWKELGNWRETSDGNP